MGNYLFIFLSQSAYACLLLAYLNINAKWLHGCALAGSSIAIAYTFLAEKEPLWVPLVWFSLFAIVNALQLGIKLWREKPRTKKKDIELDSVENYLKKSAFSHFPDELLNDFLALGMEGTVSKGDELFHIGTPIPEFYFIVEGHANTFVNKVLQEDIGPGRLLGEMILLGETVFQSSAVAVTDMKLLAWTPAKINGWVGKDFKRLSLIQTAVGFQLAERYISIARQKKLVKKVETAA